MDAASFLTGLINEKTLLRARTQKKCLNDLVASNFRICKLMAGIILIMLIMFLIYSLTTL